MPSAPAKKTAAKPAATPVVKANVAKTNPAKSAADKPVKEPASQPTKGATLRGKDFVARVAEATGAKVKDVKTTIDATLAELGRALDAGETLVLPPLGRVSVVPAKADGNAGMIRLKLRRVLGKAEGAAQKDDAKEALAEAGEDS